MTKTELMFFIGLFLGILIHMIVDNFILRDPYKQGQIDAINGIIKYELITQPDKSTVWVEKNND